MHSCLHSAAHLTCHIKNCTEPCSPCWDQLTQREKETPEGASDGSDDEFFDASEDMGPGPRSLSSQSSGQSMYHDAEEEEELPTLSAHAKSVPPVH